MGLPSM
jgi:hypothetical protein